MLWAGTPTSHLSLLDSVESKVLQIIGLSCNEAKAQGPSLSHHKQVCGLVFSTVHPPILLPLLSMSCDHTSEALHVNIFFANSKPNFQLNVNMLESHGTSHPPDHEIVEALSHRPSQIFFKIPQYADFKQPRPGSL